MFRRHRLVRRSRRLVWWDGTILAGSIGGPGYSVLFGFMFLETAFPPLAVPVLPLAGMSVAGGEASLVLTITVAVVGSTLGSCVLYGGARAVGADRLRSFVLRHSRWSSLDDAHFDRAEGWFARHADAAVLLGRCVPVVRSLVSVPAGLQPMRLPRFIALTATGNAIWALAVVGVAAAVGERWTSLSAHLRWVQLLVVTAWVVMIAVVAISRMRRRRAADRTGPPVAQDRGARPT